jgi:ribose 1,5-bisphosphokinase PhnN
MTPHRVALYLIGPPAVGKSTLMAALTAGLHAVELDGGRIPLARTMWYGADPDTPVATELGKRREAFSGTDALSMGVLPQAIDYVLHRLPTTLLAEGDRLANDRFFAALQAAGYSLEVIYLTAPAQLLEERRAARPRRQNPSWVAGRATKSAALALRWARWTLDTSEPLPALLGALRGSAAVSRLREAAGDWPCCHLHQPGPPGSCCDPDDCGPCCENCPTCPKLRNDPR